MKVAEVHNVLKLADTAVGDATVSKPNDSDHEIGRGRSGVVFLRKGAKGQDLACKVFYSRGLTKVVQWLTLGAPNPYMWNADAVQCAKIRRDILNLLVPVWTKGQVAVAGAEAAVWNVKLTTFELQTRFVCGRTPALHHSLRNATEDEAGRLWRQILPNLRSYLEHAGFDGLLWQAGIGNPVALNNFLFERTVQKENTARTRDNDGRWVWIDLESGVPAIFPFSPRVLFQYSLAHWWRRGRPLFDDVDIDRLKFHLRSNAQELRLALGETDFETLNLKAELLGAHQRKWKSLGRLQSSIQYRLVQGEIDNFEADFYSTHRFRWALNEFGRGVRASIRALRGAPASIWKRMLKLNPLDIARNGWRFLTSQRYREEFVHGYLDERIESWTRRGQLSDDHAEILRAQIGLPDSSVYIMDFGIHLAIKPAVKFFQYWLLPALFALGLLSGQTVVILAITGGSLGRTAYTLGRMVQSAARRYELPWISLGVGILPVVGNFAYPIQMLYSIRGEDEELARFMLDDGFARLGRIVPIWGGEDTWTEHLFNRIPSKIARSW